MDDLEVNVLIKYSKQKSSILNRMKFAGDYVKTREQRNSGTGEQGVENSRFGKCVFILLSNPRSRQNIQKVLL